MELRDLNPKGYVLTSTQLTNQEKLLDALNDLQELCQLSFTVTSGLRTPQDQMRINPAVKNSAHLSGEAVDLSDVDGAIYAYCIDNLDRLVHLGIYLECRTYTPRWIHLQTRVPKSGNRIFTP